MKYFLIILSLFMIFILGCSVNYEVNNDGYMCIKLIGDDTCYTPNQLTCEQYCTQTDETQLNEDKKFTKWEYTNEECKRIEFYNEEIVISEPDEILREPGTIVVKTIYYGAPWGLKDSPAPNPQYEGFKNCCCDK
jgi:hypothetical protein